MPHIVIGHVIGTVTLLMMFFAIGNYYTDYFAVLSKDAYQNQLKQISNYLSSNLVDLVTLAEITPGNQFLVKQVNMPYSINENLYNIGLTWQNSPNGNYQVVHLTASMPKTDQYVAVDLPYSNNSLVKIYSNENIPPGYLLIANHISSDAALSKATITRKVTALMVWCLKNGDDITIGFGVMSLN